MGIKKNIIVFCFFLRLLTYIRLLVMKLLIGAFQITDFTRDWSGSLQFSGHDGGNKVSVSVCPFCCCWSVMDGWMDGFLPSFLPQGRFLHT